MKGDDDFFPVPLKSRLARPSMSGDGGVAPEGPATHFTR